MINLIKKMMMLMINFLSLIIWILVKLISFLLGIKSKPNPRRAFIFNMSNGGSIKSRKDGPLFIRKPKNNEDI